MLKRTLFLLLFASLLPALPLRAQVLQPITAKEVLGTVTSKAQSDFASDAVLTNIFFTAFQYGGVGLSMDKATGKATGWLYRYFSPSLFAYSVFAGVKVPIFGAQAAQLPLDTVSQSLPDILDAVELAEPYIDSDAALAGSLAGGADAFLQAHPTAEVQFSLILDSPLQNAWVPQGKYWMFRYADAADTLTCLVHAESGQAYICHDGKSPKITSLPRTTARVGELYTYQVVAFGDPLPTYTLTVAPAGMIIYPQTGMISWTPTANQVGTQDVTVHAENVSGFDEQSFVVTVQGSATTPAFTSAPDTVAVADAAYSYTPVVTGSPRPSFTLGTAPQGMTVDGGRGRVFWTPTRTQAGRHPVSIVATNSAGSATQEYDIEVYTRPVLAKVADSYVAVGQTYSATASADARPAAQYSLDAGPSGFAIDPSTGAMSWAPTDQQKGVNTILIRATNAQGFDQTAFNIEVGTTVGVPAVPATSDFVILGQYPGPVRGDVLFVPVQVSSPVTMRLTLCDAVGRVLRSEDVVFDRAGEHALRIATAGLHSGTYHFRIDSRRSSASRSFSILR
jgi:hypothetical protein